MSGQFIPSRFEAPAAPVAAPPRLVPAGAVRRWLAAAVDLALVAVPLWWGLRMLLVEQSMGWIGLGLGAAALVTQLVLPAVSGRTLMMSALGLGMVDVETGHPVRGLRSLLRHVWPPVRGEVCDIRPHVAVPAGKRPSEAIVPPVGPVPLDTDRVTGSLISDVPTAPGGTARDQQRVQPTPAVAASPPPPTSSSVSPSSLRPETVSPAPVSDPPVSAPSSEIEEGTVARPIRVPVAEQWSLTFDTGDRVVIDGIVLVGRDPHSADAPSAVLMAIDDPRRSLSKTHASITSTPEGPVLVDLDSTNGVAVARAQNEVELQPGEPYRLQAGDEVYFGELRAVLALTESRDL
jgi:hypothetical protein